MQHSTSARRASKLVGLLENCAYGLSADAPYGRILQVVRLWGPRGDALAYRRGAAGMLAPVRLGSINSIAWHPYRPLFASGGADAIVAIYEADLTAANGPSSGSSTPRSP